MRRKRIAIAGASLALLVLAYFGPSTYRKAQMDAEVERLCAKDGGVKVYQRAELPHSMVDAKGFSAIPMVVQLADAKSPYVIQNRSRPVHLGDPHGRWSPTLHRTHFVVVRMHDQFVLGEAIGYTRYGGDPSGPWEPSSYRGSCLPIEIGLSAKVFTNWIDRR